MPPTCEEQLATHRAACDEQYAIDLEVCEGEPACVEAAKERREFCYQNAWVAYLECVYGQSGSLLVGVRLWWARRKLRAMPSGKCQCGSKS